MKLRFRFSNAKNSYFLTDNELESFWNRGFKKFWKVCVSENDEDFMASKKRIFVFEKRLFFAYWKNPIDENDQSEVDERKNGRNQMAYTWTD